MQLRSNQHHDLQLRGNSSMEVRMDYGDHGLKINVPDDALVVTLKHVPPLQNEKEAVQQAMRQPIGTLPLKQQVKATDRVAIVISDITRPTPNEKLVPWILEEISHVPVENITIINGTGTHRDQTREEFIQMLGEEVVNTYRVINHHCRERDELSYVGRSSFGCEVYLNKAYVDADVRIVTGFIEPHFFAGFSGGPKGIMPGIAGLETIQTFHNAEMIGHPLSTWGILEGNPLQQMTCEINRMCPPHFLLNVTLDENKNITSVFAGDWYEAHREGCRFVKEQSMIACPERVDVVLTSNAGYPLDQNLYQVVKGMSAAQKIVKQGGAIICVAECRDGLPDHGNYAKILKMADTPQQLIEMIRQPSFRMMDQWQVQKQAVIQTWCDVYLYSTLPEQDVRDAKLIPITNIEETLDQLRSRFGREMTVAVLPQGPLTVPYVINE